MMPAAPSIRHPRVSMHCKAARACAEPNSLASDISDEMSDLFLELLAYTTWIQRASSHICRLP